MNLGTIKPASGLLLNADVGEGLPTDVDLYPYLDQASIACGGHTGNVDTMHSAVTACRENDVMIGAHPSYPDPDNFGRVSMRLTELQLARSILQQLASLEAVCDYVDASLSYVKCHGALYNDVARDFSLFESILRLLAEHSRPLALMTSATGLTERHYRRAKELGVSLMAEAFADRLYAVDGSLMPRTFSRAVHQNVDLIVEQGRMLAVDHSVLNADGNRLKVNAISVCVHGDNVASVLAVQPLRAALNS